MGITNDTVKYAALLARIELKPQELERLSLQLKDILDFIDQLKKVDTKDSAPTSHILDIRNVLREDTSRQSLSIKDALKNAPCPQGYFFGVPKVIE